MDFLDDMRMKVRQAVDTSYGFHASSKNIRENTARARQLLSNNAFIYRVRPNVSVFGAFFYLDVHRNTILTKTSISHINIPSSKKRSIYYGSGTKMMTA